MANNQKKKDESLKSYLSDLKLPKDVLGLFLQQANKSKDEIASRVGKEITNIISKINIVDEFSKFAEAHKFKVSAEIEIIKKKSSDSD